MASHLPAPLRATALALLAVPALAQAANLRCSFTEPPPADPHPLHTEVYSSPVAFRAAVPGAPGQRESVIAALFAAPVGDAYDEGKGVLRILRADDCSQRAVLGGGALPLVSTMTPAAADLDGDGEVEVVVAGADGSTLAFTTTDGSWNPTPLWSAPLPAGASWGDCGKDNFRCSQGWGAFSVHDLDDDGAPEVIREGAVFSSTGAPLAGTPAGFGANLADSLGSFPLVANLDGDDAVELTDGYHTWEWQRSAEPPGWVEDTTFVSDATGAAHVAAADFFRDAKETEPLPELALVRNASMQILSADGKEKALYLFPALGNGSPPAVADFDGDGWPEATASYGDRLNLFDPDCATAERSGGTCPPPQCAGGCATGIAWSRPIQDMASNRTPPIAFDFDADGASEVIFADECYLRAFDSGGNVVLSHHHASCTWRENPVVAAIDASARAALVVPANIACGAGATTCPTLDPIDPGQPCNGDGDCSSGSCDQGLCRCTTSADCCSAGDDASCEAGGITCAAALPSSPGEGNTCRASRPGPRSGITVYTDPRWSRARPIWNQAAYAVTHVGDDGSIPRTSEWARNWLADTDGYRSMPALGPPLPEIFADGFESPAP